MRRTLKSVFLIGRRVGISCGPQGKKDGTYMLHKWWIPEGLDPISQLVYWLGCRAGFASGLARSGKEVGSVTEETWEILGKERGPSTSMPRELIRERVEADLDLFEEAGGDVVGLLPYMSCRMPVR